MLLTSLVSTFLVLVDIDCYVTGFILHTKLYIFEHKTCLQEKYFFNFLQGAWKEKRNILELFLERNEIIPLDFKKNEVILKESFYCVCISTRKGLWKTKQQLALWEQRKAFGAKIKNMLGGDYLISQFTL